MSEVAAKVTKIIVDQLGVSAEEVKPEASFVEDTGLARCVFPLPASTRVFFPGTSPRLSKEYP